MKKIIIAFFLFLGTYSYSQQVMTDVLRSAIQNQESSDLDVIVYFNDQVDVMQFHEKMKLQNADKNIRVKSLEKQLKEVASFSQKEFKSELQAIAGRSAEPIWIEKEFWILNAVELHVSVKDIDKIAGLSQVKRIDLNTPRYTVEKPVRIEASESRSVGGIEAGLEAVNAPQMWALGYTGRNLIFMSMDTGVFTDHPAISNRYLGNFKPQNQVWYGVNNVEPTDHASSSHGTHTTGNVLGLVDETNDTIGLAFGAYWIASDPVASTLSELLTPADLLYVYQWVLDPDGNPETTDDVPDVINNSWGYDYTLAMEFDACNLEEAHVLEVIEAAGILSPFSAGNEGPNSETTGFPAMMAFDELNTMSIGAVDGNTEGWPIADFSSRGPTTCVETGGALEIKPEVCAPGVSVRSCTGHDGFSFLSGTSMSCPHVSGALLLLKEAYPFLSTYELKESLYMTAVDLGETGEDNVYGRGMIDVYAAYQYLDITYDPIPPVSDSFDVAIEIVSPGALYYCPGDETHSVSAKFYNLGQENLENLDYSWILNDGDTLSASWTGILAPADSITVDLGEVTYVAGNNLIYVWSELPDVDREFDRFNNSDILNVNMVGQETFPWTEDFENVSDGFKESSWFAENPDGEKSWEIGESSGLQNSTQSLTINLLSSLPREGQEDAVYSPIISIPETGRINLSIDFAYMKRMEFLFKDSIKVFLSTDCGQSFPHLLYSNGGIDMATVDGNASSTLFIPETAEDWDTINMDLSAFHSEDVMIKFVSVNDDGASIYIDNVRIYLGDPDEITTPETMDVKVYPNPVNDCLILNFADGTKDVNVEIVQSNGVRVLCKKIKVVDESCNIDVSDFNPGIYFLRLISNESVYNQTVIVQ
jgi:bacillopeptidase F